MISVADGHATLFDMLGGKFVDDRIRGYYDTLPIFHPIVQVSLESLATCPRSRTQSSTS